MTTLDALLCSRPATLTIAHAEACLPGSEVNPEWQAKRDAGTLPEEVLEMCGRLRTVWPEERLTEEEARWILALSGLLSSRDLASSVLGDDLQITGIHLEQAAHRALEPDCAVGHAEPSAEPYHLLPSPPTSSPATSGDRIIGSLPVNLAAEICARDGRKVSTNSLSPPIEEKETMTLDLTPLQKALAALERGLSRATAAPGDEELRDACIQRFEFTYELAWKMLKRRLEMDLPNPQEVDGMNYRTLIRVGAEQGLIDDVTAWFVYRDKRNLTSHTYDAAKAADVAACLPAFAAHARCLLEKLMARGAEDA